MSDQKKFTITNKSTTQPSTKSDSNSIDKQIAYFTPLNEFRTIEVSGADANNFLQSQFTLDITAIPENHCSYGAYCDAKGKVQHTLHVLKQDEHFLILCNTDNITPLLKTLKKYALFSKVCLKPSEQTHFFGLINAPANMPIQNNVIEWKLSHTLSIFQADTIDLEKLKEKFKTYHFQKTNDNAFKYAKIKQKIVSIHSNTRNQFTPHMLGMNKHNGLCFTKGCYLGQEVIARTEHLGKAKREMATIHWKKIETSEIGDPLLDSDKKVIGILLDFCDSENQHGIGLVCIKKGYDHKQLFLNNQAITSIKT